MELFSKEKEIIFKITNAVLLIWVVAATVILFSSVINLVVKEPVQNYTYSEYEQLYCDTSYYGSKDLTAEQIKSNCKLDYESHIFNTKTSNYYKLITLYTSLANVVIVGGVLFVLNKKKK